MTAIVERPPPDLERRVELVQPRNPAWWLFIAATTLGAFLYARNVIVTPYATLPTAVIASIVVWTPYLLAWALFISRRQLFVPLARLTRAATVLWGAFAATALMAMNANDAILSLVAKLASPEVATAWGAAISAPLVEESAKALGVVVVLLVLRDRLRSPFEAMILGAFVGLGFQVAEDVLYSVNTASGMFGQRQGFAVAEMLIARGIFTPFSSHMLYTAVAAAGIGFLIAPGAARNVRLGVVFVLAAPAMHFFWDSPLLGAFGPLRAIPALLVYVYAYRRSVSREHAWVMRALEPEVVAGTIGADDLEALGTTRRARRRHLRTIRHASGQAVAHATARLAHTAGLLAGATADAGGTESAEVVTRRAAVVVCRDERDALLPAPPA